MVWLLEWFEVYCEWQKSRYFDDKELAEKMAKLYSETSLFIYQVKVWKQS